MGGYGAYVWPSFAIAALVIMAMIAASLRGLRRAKRTLLQLHDEA